MDLSIFENIGLTKRETNVYLSLLELGSTTVSGIIDKTGTPSSKIYEILKKLENKGLASHIKIKNKRYYQAADPPSLLNYLDDKKAKIAQALPELLERQKFAKRKQSTEMYEGANAIFSMLRNLIANAKPNEMYLAFTHGQEHQDETIRTFYKNFIKRRAEKKLDIRLLMNEKIRPLFKDLYTKKEMSGTKAHFTNFRFPQGITIFRNFVIILSWKTGPTAIKIESEQLANEFKEFFLELWDSTKQ